MRHALFQVGFSVGFLLIALWSTGCKSVPAAGPTDIPKSLVEAAQSSTFVLSWDGVDGTTCGVIATLVGESEIRTAYHAMQLHPGSGIFLEDYRRASIDGVATSWATKRRGDTTRLRAGSRSDDWAELSVSPAPRHRSPAIVDLSSDLSTGTIVYIAGFEGVRCSRSLHFESIGPLSIRVGRVIRPVPAERATDQEPERLVYVEIDDPGISRGWSGAPVFVVDSAMGPKMVGTMIGIGVRGPLPEGFSSTSGVEGAFGVFVR